MIDRDHLAAVIALAGDPGNACERAELAEEGHARVQAGCEQDTLRERVRGGLLQVHHRLRQQLGSHQECPKAAKLVDRDSARPLDVQLQVEPSQ